MANLSMISLKTGVDRVKFNGERRVADFSPSGFAFEVDDVKTIPHLVCVALMVVQLHTLLVLAFWVLYYAPYKAAL